MITDRYPEPRENTPPALVSQEPAEGWIRMDEGGSSIFSVELLDLDNAEDLEVYWFAFPAEEDAGQIDRISNVLSDQNTTDPDVALYKFDFRPTSPGCWRVEASVCDGLHGNDTETLGCADDAFHLLVHWYVNVASELTPEPPLGSCPP